MLKHLIFLAAVYIVRSAAVKVGVTYDEPVLTLSLTLSERNIHAVVFHIVIKGVVHTGQGIHTSEGWQYTIREIRLDAGDEIVAYADVYEANGYKHWTTEGTIFSPDAHAGARLPSRHIRGAVLFRDDFNKFNTHDWRYEVSMYGGGNWEFQVYTNDDKNVYTENGYLYLRPTLTVEDPRFDATNFLKTGTMDMSTLFGTCTEEAFHGCYREGRNGLLPPVMSGKVMSVPTLRYGEVEIRARIPKGDWLWPAIWMLPSAEKYGTWPQSGEIDIMESRGNNGDLGVGTVTSTLHWGTTKDLDKYRLTNGEKKSMYGSWHDEFHVWKLVWTSEYLATYVDGSQIMYVTPGGRGFWQKGGFSGGDNIWKDGENMAPFDQEFYMIFNLAVGGTDGYFPDNAYWDRTKPWNNDSPQAAEDFWNGRGHWLPTWQADKAAMLIDYVEFRHL